MKTRTIALAAASFLMSFTVLAQEPVVGVDDPESLFKDSDAALNRNKQAALHIMRELLQCGQWDRAGEWLTDAYHQHNPNAASGLKGVVYFFTQVAKVKRTDNCGKLTSPVVAVMADDDYVTVMTPRHLPRPGSQCEQQMRKPPAERGKCADNEMYYTTWFDTWRFVDGKADEHWDPATLSAPAQQ
jgi:predicted SnoaL-like aldol condensation-catalyzing enzyme